MEIEDLYRRYQELQAYVGWTADDAERIKALEPMLEASFPAMLDDFYAEIEKHPEARKVITGGAQQVERLKGTLLTWLRELLSGQYDRDYVGRRWRVGLRHVEVGLNQVYTNAALSRLRLGLMRTLQETWKGGAAELRATVQALSRLLDLDLAIIEDAYQAAYSERLQRAERLAAHEKLLQSERLAAIGQMVTGLAHESGNALARSQTCLEMLAADVQDRPEAVDLVRRIQKAQDHLAQLYHDVRNYAGPIRLERDERDISGIWRQAWNNLSGARRGRNAILREHVADLDLSCSVDPFRLEQVFRNILENSLAACTDPVEIDVHCAKTQLSASPALRIAVADNGPGLSAEQRQRIFEPFFTTKTKGTGLGMAIAQRIIEAHGGCLEVGKPSSGAEIILTLPRSFPHTT